MAFWNTIFKLSHTVFIVKVPICCIFAPIYWSLEEIPTLRNPADKNCIDA